MSSSSRSLAAAFAMVSLAFPASAQDFPRTFDLPQPLFSATSPWNQRCDTAAVEPNSAQQILVLYRILLGDTTHLQPPGEGHPNPPWPYIDVSYDEYCIPIFEMGTGQMSVQMLNYDGSPGGNNPKLPGDPVTVPNTAGIVRPSAPTGADSDGHMVLFNPTTQIMYDFWQATTVLGAGGGTPGSTVQRAGTVDFFDGHTDGVNPATYHSARACGTPLLAGLLVPEDVESGAISHALAFATISPRNLSADPFDPLTSDWMSPCSTTETDYYSTNPNALASGQRIRLRQPPLYDEHGATVNEAALAPITRMYLTCLRTYGAYLVDAAGGFSFYAEDIHTADLNLTDDQVNTLIGQPPGTPLTPGMTKWEIVIETINVQLENAPLADGTWTPWDPVGDPATAVVHHSNFDVVAPFAPVSGHALQLR